MVIQDIVTLDIILIIVAFVVWPPYILMYVAREDIAWYNKLSKRVWLAPRYGIFMVLWAISLAVLITAGIIHLLGLTSFLIPNVYFYASTILFFVHITFLHYFLRTLFYQQSPISSIGTALLTLGTAIAVTVLYAIEGYWISFGLCVGYSVWHMYVTAMTINWYLSHPPRNDIKITTTSTILTTTPPTYMNSPAIVYTAN